MPAPIAYVSAIKVTSRGQDVFSVLSSARSVDVVIIGSKASEIPFLNLHCNLMPFYGVQSINEISIINPPLYVLTDSSRRRENAFPLALPKSPSVSIAVALCAVPIVSLNCHHRRAHKSGKFSSNLIKITQLMLLRGSLNYLLIAFCASRDEKSQILEAMISRIHVSS